MTQMFVIAICCLLTNQAWWISVGDTIDVRGPGGLLVYEGRGAFELKEDKKAAPKQVKVDSVVGRLGLGYVVGSWLAVGRLRLDQLSSGEASEHDCWRDRHHSNAPVGEQLKLLKFNQRMLQTSPFLSFFCLLYNVHTGFRLLYGCACRCEQCSEIQKTPPAFPSCLQIRRKMTFCWGAHGLNS